MFEGFERHDIDTEDARIARLSMICRNEEQPDAVLDAVGPFLARHLR